jgi:hypothetical protein
MHVAFVTRGDARVEIEAAPQPFRGWWRARVVAAKQQPLPRSLPWSYGTTEAAAVDNALALWQHARAPSADR